MPSGATMCPEIQSLNDIPDPTKLKVPDIVMVRGILPLSPSGPLVSLLRCRRISLTF